MSHIFDALQRSQAEHGGAGASSRSTATELLERAEREAVLQWKAAGGHRRAGANGSEPGAVAERELPAAVEELHTGTVELGGDRPILSEFPHLQSSPGVQNRLVAVTDGESPAAEAFRLLAVRLRHLRRERRLHRLLITSSIPREGKSLVSANLACTLAGGFQQKVLLLEGDLRRPSLLHAFGIEEAQGICEWLRGERSLHESIYFIETPGLCILPAGNAHAKPLEVLQSGKVATLLEQLNEWFDWIIIDSPPVMPLADTSIWARLADGVLLVTRPGVTEKRPLRRGLEALEQKKVIGALLNSCDPNDNGYYYYRSGSGDTHSEPRE